MQGAGTDLQRRAGNRPWAKLVGEGFDKGWIADGKAEAQPRQPPELAKAFQDETSRACRFRYQAVFWADIAKAFVDDRQVGGQVGLRPEPSIGVVGVNQNPGASRVGVDLPAMGGKGGSVLVVSWGGDVDGACRTQRRNACDQG